MLPTTPSGQQGSPFSPLRIGTGANPSSPSAIRAQYRTVTNSLRRLATDRSISGSSSAIGDSPGGSEYSSAHARFPSSGSTADIKVVRVIGLPLAQPVTELLRLRPHFGRDHEVTAEVVEIAGRV